MSKIKTNAMRILDSKHIEYTVLSYDSRDGKIDGVSVANKIGRDANTVFKTLVTVGKSREIYIFIIPVEKELDLKKAASAAKEKSIEMIHPKDITRYTGYIRGGCSPIGMKKKYPTFIDESALMADRIIISGGKIGVQIEIAANDLKEIINGQICELTK